jgi:hypothetical protein
MEEGIVSEKRCAYCQQPLRPRLGKARRRYCDSSCRRAMAYAQGDIPEAEIERQFAAAKAALAQARRAGAGQ